MADTGEHVGVGDVRVDPTMALRRQYVGLPTDPETRRLVKKHFGIPKELEALADQLVQDPRTDYGTFEDLARHALWELLRAYYDQGYPNSQLGAELEYEKSIRNQSYRAERRKQLLESFHRFDDELDTARRQGDWNYISEHLSGIEGWIADAPTESVRQSVRHVAAQSLSVRQAVLALLRWKDRVPQEVKEQGERWRVGLEEW